MYTTATVLTTITLKDISTQTTKALELHLRTLESHHPYFVTISFYRVVAIILTFKLRIFVTTIIL